MDEWKPKELYCTHCGKLNKNDDGKFSAAKFKKEELNQGHIRLGTSSYTRATYSIPEKSWAKMNEEQSHSHDEWCSCGHRIIDCDCKPGCECGCNKQYLGSY
jgi:hypothetical protein